MGTRQIRRSQYISPFGVGAILDIGKESFVASDISKWHKNAGEVIHLKRLEHRLHVTEFRMPPTPKGAWERNPLSLPYYRFPQWLFCPSCRKMTRWSINSEKTGETPRCGKCRGKKELVPMRFVMACEKGHMSDIDWSWWAHSRSNVAADGRCSSQELSFRSVANRGGGLASLEVRCEKCGEGRSLEGIASKNSMQSIGVRCSGKQPWEFVPQGTNIECEHTPQGLQRGATNLYYPKTVSALDIPCGQVNLEDEEKKNEIRSHYLYKELKDQLSSGDGEVAITLANRISTIIAESVHCETQDVMDIASGDSSEDMGSDLSDNEGVISESDILIEEWPILVNPPKNDDHHQIFRAEDITIAGLDNSYGLENLMDKLVLVHRLREVRVLRGFHRVIPGDEETLVRADLGKSYPWLPAIEVFGEGIFISFKEAEIASWCEKHGSIIQDRIGLMKTKYDENNLEFLPSPTPRFVMLHTFAHLFMLQLSFECGYSASSLRERIYAAEPESDSGPMAGILIYTADSDSEGSLGGLVRQGRPDRLIPTLLSALEKGTWCSSDPVCRELPGQGMNGLNRAACHSCALVSETSCTCNNVLLDRMLVLGNDHGEYGFFSSVLKEAEMGIDE